MSEDLFQPSLTEDYQEIKTYNISKLFYVAFFGGVIPTAVLATKNANWLRVDKKMIVLLNLLGALILLTKPFLIFVAGARLIYKGETLLLYLGYYLVMKKKFVRHIVTGGEVQPILKAAILWSVVGMAIEAGFIFGVMGILKYV